MAIYLEIDMAIAKKPVTEEPVTEEPVTEEPVTEEPVTEEPVPGPLETPAFLANDKVTVRNNSPLPYFSYFECIVPDGTGSAMGYETYAYDFLEVV